MRIFIAILLLVVIGVAFVASRQPDEFRVTRTAVLNAPPAAIFEHVNDLEKWQAWSPWAKMDPDAKTTFGDKKAGVGAKMAWEGDKTGKGEMTILESASPSFLRFKLEFFKPMKGVNTVDFTFVPQDKGAQVTWTMFGPSPFISKVVSLFMNCEKMVGEQFDAGLANLKAIVEKK